MIKMTKENDYIMDTKEPEQLRQNEIEKKII